MKQIFNWTIGSFFRTIGRIVAYLIIGGLIAFLLMYKPKAATLTSYNTYEQYWNDEAQTSTSCGTANRYSYTTYSNNNPANDLWQVGTIGTRVYSKGAQIGFNFQYNLTAGKYYDVVINFMSSDLSNSLNTTNVHIDSGTSCRDFDDDRVGLVGFTLSNSGTNYSNKATVRIVASSATTYWGIWFSRGAGNYIAGPNNFGVSSITISEVDVSNSNVIIDNATNNTTNIINNNNENTQQIINNQNELLGSQCPNLFDVNTITTGDITTAYSSIRASSRQDIYLTSGTYYFKTNISNGYQYALSINDVNHPPLGSYPTYIYDSGWQTSTSKSFTISQPGWFVVSFKKGSNENISLSDIKSFYYMLSNQNVSYCEYGSYSSKLDDVNTSINDLTDTLTDTNTDDDANDLSSYFNNLDLTSHNTLANIVLLPVNFLSQLLDNTSDDDICAIYKNKNICLPSGSLIWGRNHSLINAFKVFFQLVVGGYLSYKCLTAVFHTAENALQPDKTTAEVMKL